MSIRLTALYIFLAFLIIYAWKDWFISLCGLILMMAVITHEDMPKTMFGIQGLNPWNILFLAVFIAWFATRHRENLKWDMPGYASILLLIYLVVIIIGFLRAVLDRSYIEDYPLKSLFSEELINTIKWVIPGILLFDGCRTRRRVITVLVCILAMYFIVSVQVIRFMPFSAAYNINAMSELRIRLGRYIGYSACDISAMLAGASWGTLAALSLIRKKMYKILALIIAGTIMLGQVMTGGRAGYVAWVASGLVMCFIKWRKYLVLAPVVLILLPIIFPASADRMLSGFGKTDVSGHTVIDNNEITSDRILMWPYVIDKICESPLIGYGRLAMQRTGLAKQMLEMGLSFPHPHNVYLETLLDNGILGSLPIFVFWGMVLVLCTKLFRSSNRLCSAVGGLTLALTLAQLFAGIGAQHYYPRISTLSLWCAMFLSLRIYLEQKRSQMQATSYLIPQNQQLLQPAVVFN